MSAPDAFAMARDATPMARIIAAEIAERGPIPFARFMELALGHPEHGYYARPALGWGRAGDYETSPEVHPVFAYLWAEQVAECWELLGRPDPFHLVEPGAGSGRFAADLLWWLRERAPGCFAATRPVLLDGFPARREEQRRALGALDLHAEHAAPDEWTARPGTVTGVVISNEFFDALPVHLVSAAEDAAESDATNAELVEWHVARAEPAGDGDTGSGFRFVPAAPSTAALAEQLRRVGAWPAPGTRVEVSPRQCAAMRGLAARLERGYLLTLDYGYEARELYAPWRRAGTLMAFRSHSPQPDPLAEPGRLDLTAHVDLTALRLAATEGDDAWRAAPPVAQAEALIALGIGDHLQAVHTRAAADPMAYAEARRAVDTLLEPAGLGRIRLLAMSRHAPLDRLRCLQTPAPLGAAGTAGEAGASGAEPPR